MTQDYSKYNLTEKENEEKERQGSVTFFVMAA